MNEVRPHPADPKREQICTLAIPELWTPNSISVSSTAYQDEPLREPLSFEEALQWLRHSTPRKPEKASEWKFGAITLVADYAHDRDQIAHLRELMAALGWRVGYDPMALNGFSFQSFSDAEHPPLERRFGLFGRLYGICWTSDLETKQTKTLMYSKSSLRGKDQLLHIWAQIARNSKFGTHALLVGYAALEAAVTSEQYACNALLGRLRQVQIQTGYHGFYWVESEPLNTAHLPDMSRDACKIAFRSSTAVLRLQSLLKFADFLLTECESTDKILQQLSGHVNKSLRDALGLSQKVLPAKVKRCRRASEALLLESTTLENMTGVMVQTLFTLATQRDASVSIGIAQDSRTLAQQAIRDSTSMKAIAAVTMCFLPGTFVASLFAMPLFDWPLAPGQTVSSHFWIYWAVTIPLTIVVISIWLAWTNHNDLYELLARVKSHVKAQTKGGAHV